MIVRTRGGHDREVRRLSDFTQGWNDYLGGSLGTPTASGETVDPDTAAAIPAVFNAYKLIAETTGRLPLEVYKGYKDDKRAQPKTWQWELLHRMPNPDRSAMNFWADVAACIESRGDAFLMKAKSRRRVEALFVLNPDWVKVDRDRETGELTYTLLNRRGQARETFTKAEIVHIRGFTLNGGDRGITGLHSEAVGSALARYKHEGSVYRNGGSTPYALKFEQRMDRTQAAQALAVWKSTTAGIENTGNPGVLSNGAGIEKLGMTLEDAQFILSHEFSIGDVGRMFNLPVSLLNGGKTQPTEEESRRFMNFSMAGRLERIAQEVSIDPDIFPDAELYAKHFVDEFLAADALKTASIQHYKIQNGSLLIDEARAADGRDPLKIPPPDRPGLIPQLTPVGGAPNPTAVGANAPTETE